MKKLILLFSIVLLLAGCFSNKQEEETESLVNTVSIGENSMDYVKFGNGSKVFVIIPGLSIHSVMGSAEAIKEAYNDFSEEYTVYLFDRAKNISDGYSIEDMAKDTANAMKNLGIEKAYIFGASQGGMIAEYIAIDYPELVEKLVLGSTLSKPNDTANNLINEWITLAKEKDEDGLLNSFVENVYSKNTLDAYKDTLISANKGITDEEYERFIILAKAIETFNCYDKLSEIKCPVLVLGSNGDKVVTPVGSTEIAEAINCDIYMYEDTYGHGVYDEAADYKQRILDFFNK